MAQRPDRRALTFPDLSAVVPKVFGTKAEHGNQTTEGTEEPEVPDYGLWTLDAFPLALLATLDGSLNNFFHEFGYSLAGVVSV